MAVIVIQSMGIVATGSDETSGPIAWGDVQALGAGASQPVGLTNTQTVSAIDTPVVYRATFTTNGDPVGLSWVVNTAIQSRGLSPKDANVALGDDLALRLTFITSDTNPRFASGTVTVTNVTDGGAAVDSFDYILERTGTAP